MRSTNSPCRAVYRTREGEGGREDKRRRGQEVDRFQQGLFTRVDVSFRTCVDALRIDAPKEQDGAHVYA